MCHCRRCGQKFSAVWTCIGSREHRNCMTPSPHHHFMQGSTSKPEMKSMAASARVKRVKLQMQIIIHTEHTDLSADQKPHKECGPVNQNPHEACASVGRPKASRRIRICTLKYTRSMCVCRQTNTHTKHPDLSATQKPLEERRPAGGSPSVAKLPAVHWSRAARAPEPMRWPLQPRLQPALRHLHPRPQPHWPPGPCPCHASASCAELPLQAHLQHHPSIIDEPLHAASLCLIR